MMQMLPCEIFWGGRGRVQVQILQQKRKSYDYLFCEAKIKQSHRKPRKSGNTKRKRFPPTTFPQFLENLRSRKWCLGGRDRKALQSWQPYFRNWVVYCCNSVPITAEKRRIDHMHREPASINCVFSFFRTRAFIWVENASVIGFRLFSIPFPELLQKTADWSTVSVPYDGKENKNW